MFCYAYDLSRSFHNRMLLVGRMFLSLFAVDRAELLKTLPRRKYYELCEKVYDCVDFIRPDLRGRSILYSA